MIFSQSLGTLWQLADLHFITEFCWPSFSTAGAPTDAAAGDFNPIRQTD
jgi:hypothetical protein